MKPDTEHVPAVLDASDTARPDDADGATANGVDDHGRSAGSAKVIV